MNKGSQYPKAKKQKNIEVMFLICSVCGRKAKKQGSDVMGG